MKETTKASERRINDKTIDFQKIFKGYGIDIGPGNDPLPVQLFPNISSLELFDQDRGNAENLCAYFNQKTFDFIHMSNVLEHLSPSPTIILKTYKLLLKPGGHIVITVPDFELYEKGFWPSKFNSDHKWAFADNKTITQYPNYFRIINPHSIVDELRMFYNCKRCELITTNYDYSLSKEIDQTFDFNKRVECCWEIILENI